MINNHENIDTGSDELEATALRFTPAHEAPEVLARGRGEIARKIIEVARRNSLPVVQDQKFSEELQSLPVGQEIPENLYRVAASIYASIYRLNQRL